MKIRTFLAALGAAAALISMPAQAYLYSAIYAFGDSLSDNGQSLMVKAPDTPPPASSDGPVAVQFLATAYGIPLFDYAVGGATSGTANTDYPSPHPLANSGVRNQVATFLDGLGANQADASALYVVSGGSNDFLADTAGDAVALGELIALNLITAVTDLYGKGARHFLLPLLPDIGLTPFALGLVDPSDPTVPNAAQQISALVDLLNSGLSDAMSQAFAAMPEGTFTIFDTAAAQRAVIADPAAHNLIDVTTPCLDVQGAPTPACATSLFLDDLHPTSAASQILARDFQAALPEPTSALLAGLALVAAVSTRRRAEA